MALIIHTNMKILQCFTERTSLRNKNPLTNLLKKKKKKRETINLLCTTFLWAFQVGGD